MGLVVRIAVLEFQGIHSRSRPVKAAEMQLMRFIVDVFVRHPAVEIEIALPGSYGLDIMFMSEVDGGRANQSGATARIEV